MEGVPDGDSFPQNVIDVELNALTDMDEAMKIRVPMSGKNLEYVMAERQKGWGKALVCVEVWAEVNGEQRQYPGMYYLAYVSP